MKLNPYAWPWRLLIEAIPCWGEDLEVMEDFLPVRDILERFKELNQNSEFYFLSKNFPKTKWENEEWLKWLDEQHGNNVKLIFVGGKNVESEKTITDLLRRDVIIVKTVEGKPPICHLGLSTDPKKIWFEGYHSRRGKAYGCFFTHRPYEEVWEKTKTFFDDVLKEASPFDASSGTFSFRFPMKV